MLVYKDRIDKFYQYLIVFLGLSIPLTVVGAKIAAFLLVLVWLLTGDYKNKIIQLNTNPVAKYSLIFFSVHIFGLLWTEDILWGMEVVKKMIDFGVLLPILPLLFHKENLKYYIGAFLISIIFSQIASYLILFDVIEPFRHATFGNPTPFMSSISHGPFMAFAFYLFLKIASTYGSNMSHRFVLFFMSALTAVTIFTNNGRTGQVAYFILVLVIIWQNFGLRLKTFATFFFVTTFTLVLAVNFSPTFKDRAVKIVDEYQQYIENPNISGYGSSIGLRIAMAKNSLEIVKDNILFGVGTGDFKNLYKSINEINTPGLPSTENPHNMYILLLTQLGLFGLLPLLALFLKMILTSKKMSPGLVKDIGFALTIMFFVINFSDSYLLGHFTTFLFIFFSACIFCNSIYEKNPNNNSKI